MQVMAAQKSELSATLRRQGGTMARYADVVDSSPGDTMGEALWNAQVERRKLMATKQRSLWAGLGGMGLLTAEMALNAGTTSSIHVLGRVGVMLASAACIAHGGMTGDKVDHAARRIGHLSYVARELRALGPAGNVSAQASVAQGLTPGAPTRSEMLELVRATENALEPGVLREQVASDRKVLEGLAEGEADSLRAQIADQSKLYGQLTMAGLLVGGASAVGAMFGLGAAGVILMGGSMGLGILAQDRRDDILLRRDVVDRWELQVADLKGIGALAQGGPTGGATAVTEHFVQLGGVRVPVKVRQPA